MRGIACQDFTGRGFKEASVQFMPPRQYQNLEA
jgi:hypothetical protein